MEPVYSTMTAKNLRKPSICYREVLRNNQKANPRRSSGTCCKPIFDRLVCKSWHLHTCTPEIFNRLFKVENREQQEFCLAQRRSHQKVPYSADWLTVLQRMTDSKKIFGLQEQNIKCAVLSKCAF